QPRKRSSTLPAREIKPRGRSGRAVRGGMALARRKERGGAPAGGRAASVALAGKACGMMPAFPLPYNRPGEESTMQPVPIAAAPRPSLPVPGGALRSPRVLTTPQDTPLQEAARLLSKSDISGAPVVDGAGRCLGVLSSHDFVTWAGEEGEAVRFVA